jgi:uncharacterized protein YbcI
MSAAPSDAVTAAAVSEAVSRLFLDKFGKGPVHAETFVNGDLVVTLMRDVFTVAERTMIADGKADSVLTTRMLWQQATAQMFKSAIAEVTGRTVLTVISGFELTDEVATEVFVLGSPDDR